MSVLIAILYSEESKATEVLEDIVDLVSEGRLDIEDSCAVTKEVNGRIRLQQESNLSVIGAVAGLAIGTFLGWFVLLPYLGIPGAILGAMIGKTSDRGISDSYMKSLAKEMKPQSSVLFLLLRDTPVEVALRELAPYGGRVFHTSLSKADEQLLEEKLEILRNQKSPEPDRSPDLHD